MRKHTINQTTIYLSAFAMLNFILICLLTNLDFLFNIYIKPSDFILSVFAANIWIILFVRDFSIKNDQVCQKKYGRN